jgi:tripartite-type tricarboxylate transporter receptor subunit TctC
MRPLLRSSLCAITLLLGSATVALAQSDYPNRTIKIIAPSLPGGGVDLVARTIADGLSRAVGQPVVVENQSGGSGIVPSLATARAAPDGYTLMVGFVSTHGTNPAVRKLPYDAIKEFTPIAMVAGTPNVFVVGPDVPANSLKEFVAYAKANPDKLSSRHADTSHDGAVQAGGEVRHGPYRVSRHRTRIHGHRRRTDAGDASGARGSASAHQE